MVRYVFLALTPVDVPYLSVAQSLFYGAHHRELWLVVEKEDEAHVLDFRVSPEHTLQVVQQV
jgi:hypothetical protein